MVVVVLIMRVMIKMVMVMITMMMASHSLGGLYGFLFVPFAVGELTKKFKKWTNCKN